MVRVGGVGMSLNLNKQTMKYERMFLVFNRWRFNRLVNKNTDFFALLQANRSRKPGNVKNS